MTRRANFQGAEIGNAPYPSATDAAVATDAGAPIHGSELFQGLYETVKQSRDDASNADHYSGKYLANLDKLLTLLKDMGAEESTKETDSAKAAAMSAHFNRGQQGMSMARKKQLLLAGGDGGLGRQIWDEKYAGTHGPARGY